MTIKTTKTTEQEINIDLPYFGKYAYGVFVILAENKCIEANEYTTLPAWNIRTTVDASMLNKPHTQIIRSEFNAEYERIVDAIHEDMMQNIQAIRLMEEANAPDEVEDPAMDEILHEQKQSL